MRLTFAVSNFWSTQCIISWELPNKIQDNFSYFRVLSKALRNAHCKINIFYCIHIKNLNRPKHENIIDTIVTKTATSKIQEWKIKQASSLLNIRFPIIGTKAGL